MCIYIYTHTHTDSHNRLDMREQSLVAKEDRAYIFNIFFNGHIFIMEAKMVSLINLITNGTKFKCL